MALASDNWLVKQFDSPASADAIVQGVKSRIQAAAEAGYAAYLDREEQIKNNPPHTFGGHTPTQAGYGAFLDELGVKFDPPVTDYVP